MLIKLLAYFVPCAVNFISGGFIFAIPNFLAQSGCRGVTVGLSVTVWGIAYCLVTMLIGRFVTVSNSVKFILTGGLILAGTSAGFFIFDQIFLQFVWMVTAGIGGALFCVPFQLLAKSLESGSVRPSAVTACAFYMFMSSIGLALGPLTFGLLNKYGFIVTFVLALAVTGSVMMLARMRHQVKSGVASGETGNVLPEKPLFSLKTYDKLGFLGWIVGALGVITVCQVRAMWPKLGNELHISSGDIAYVLTLFNAVQAMTSLFLSRSKTWMFRRFPAVMMMLCGVIALGGFALGTTPAVFYGAAVLYGIYAGCFFFCLVCLGLLHPVRNGFFVTGNEVIVGIISMIAPLSGGFFTDIFGTASSAFVFAMVIGLLLFASQWIILSPRNLEPWSEEVSAEK
jgi:MFS family permease